MSKQEQYALATIEVIRNPNQPEITSGICSKSIYESVNVGTQIFNVSARDDDGVRITQTLGLNSIFGLFYATCSQRRYRTARVLVQADQKLYCQLTVHGGNLIII